MDTEVSKSKLRQLAHSPTMQQPLNSNLVLPELPKIASNFAFGLNQDNMSDIQQWEPASKVAREYIESDLSKSNLKQSNRLRGLQGAIQSGLFKHTDIERNSILSFVQDKKKGSNKGIVATARKAVHSRDNDEFNDDIRSLMPNPSKLASVFHRRNNSTIEGPIKAINKHGRAMSTIRAQNLELEIDHRSSRNDKSEIYHTISHQKAAKKIDLM